MPNGPRVQRGPRHPAGAPGPLQRPEGARLLPAAGGMGTRVVEVDLDSALPSKLPLDGHTRAWLVGFRGGVPVGAALLEPDAGTGSIDRERVAAAAAGMTGSGELPPCLPGRPPSVSVIVCTRGRPDRLAIVLESLRAQTLSGFELVIVDNAPTDDRTRRVVERAWPGAAYVVEPVPGLPRARNAGVRAATGEVLAFTDDDCRVVPVWAETFARAFAADAELGCVTGPILPMELDTPAQEAMESRGGFNRGWARRRWTLADSAHESPVYPVQAWQFGAGGTFALSRRCALELGGFDEALNKSEDIDVFYRVLRAGWALAFEPGAAVRHRHLPQWSQLSRRMFDWGWAYLALLDKIARGDTAEYAGRARLERRNWLTWQVRERVRAAVRGRAGVPAGLVVREIAGGLLGYRGYPLARIAAARRAARHGGTAVTPPPVRR